MMIKTDGQNMVGMKTFDSSPVTCHIKLLYFLSKVTKFGVYFFPGFINPTENT